MGKVLTKEQFEVLDKYKDILENVLKTNSLRGAVRKNTLEIAEVLDIKNRNYNCGACVFKIYKQAAELYFSELENRKKEVEAEEQEQEKEVKDSKQKSKKKGRKNEKIENKEISSNA